MSDLFITLTGRSCVGKDFLIKKLLDEYGDLFDVLVSTTSRPPRSQDEIDNQVYHFVSEKEFIDMCNADMMMEFRRVKDNYYGITFDELALKRASGKALLMILEPNGVYEMIRKVDAIGMEYFSVFLDAPDSLLLKRLNERSPDSKRAWQIVTEEMKWKDMYPYQAQFYIENDTDIDMVARFIVNHVQKRFDQMLNIA